MRVLVAEDDPLIRLLMVETLTDDGFEIVQAETGSQACSLIDDPDHLDLVVTDLNMPGADGVTVACRARAVRPSVPVLFVTARTDLLRSMSAPMPYSTLAKPFSMRQLSSVVERLMTLSGQN